MLNLAFAAVPAWVVCPYDVGRLPPAVTDDAWRTHPTVWSGSRHASERFTAPAELLAEVPEPVPDLPGPPVLELDPAPDVVRLRRELARLGERIGMASERVDDLTIVVA